MCCGLKRLDIINQEIGGKIKVRERKYRRKCRKNSCRTNVERRDENYRSLIGENESRRKSLFQSPCQGGKSHLEEDIVILFVFLRDIKIIVFNF